MSTRDDILSRYRRGISADRQYEMPDLDGLKGVEYPDAVGQFISMSEAVGSKVVTLGSGEDVNEAIRKAYPDARVFASNLPEVTIATLNPDTVAEAQELNGTDVGIVRGEIGVAENGCVWIPQTMKERAVCFISEYGVTVVLTD